MKLATALLPLSLLALSSSCGKPSQDTTAPVTAPAAAADEADLAATLELPERPFDAHVSQLDNGLKIITLEDHSAPIAAVQLWYHVGSKDEKPNRRGFAHMFEHMMFRGTQTIGPKAHFEYIRRVGGDTNAYTSFDNTTYIQTVPSNQVEMVLWLEAERMAFLKINDGYFDTERNVVAEEYRMGQERPYGTAPDKILQQVFTKHPYRWTPIGNMDELAAADAKELQEFWNTYYVPNNATLVVVGDVDHTKIEAMAQQYFGFIPKYPDPPRVDIVEPPLTEPLKIKIKERNGPVPIAAVGWRTAGIGHPDEVELEMLATILGGGESSRLHRDLVTDRELAMAALAASFSLEDDGIFAAAGVMSPFGSEPDEVLAALRKHIGDIIADGVTEQELRKAKNGMLRDAVASQTSVASKAMMIGNAAVIGGDLEAVNRRLVDIRDVTAADLQRVAKRYLVPQSEIEIRIKPNLLGFIVDQIGKDDDDDKGGDDKAGGAETISGDGAGKPGLTRPGGFGREPVVAPLTPPDVSIATAERTLDNGLKVVVLENDELPMVNVMLGLDYGAWADPADAPGLASVAVPMLTRGTKGHDYQAMADELDLFAISLSGNVSMDALTVQGSALSNQADRLVRLMAEAVRTPTFDEKELDKYFDQTRTSLAIAERAPEWLADRELRKRMFGEHPYARLPDAQARQLDAITPKALHAWWGTHARPDAAVLYVAGSIKPDDAFALAQTHFGDWEVRGPAPKVTVPTLPKPAKTKIYLVDRAGAQSQIRVGHPGIARSHPDYVTTRVLSDVFGGGFNSRLNDTIRVKKGLTYGAGGGFSASRFGGRFSVRTFSKNATVAETVEAVLEEIDRLKREKPSAREQADSISYLLGKFAADRETPQDLLSALWRLEVEDLPADYHQRYVESVAKVGADDVVDAAGRLVDADHLVIVVVGPAKTLKKALSKIADVEVVDPTKE